MNGFGPTMGELRLRRAVKDARRERFMRWLVLLALLLGIMIMVPVLGLLVKDLFF